MKYGGPTGMDGLDDDGNYPQQKTEPTNMQEYPTGSGRFMSLQDLMEARNADARKNLNVVRAGSGTPNQGGQPSTNALATLQKPTQPTPPLNQPVADKPSWAPQNLMVSPTGNLSDIPEDQRWNPL